MGESPPSAPPPRAFPADVVGDATLAGQQPAPRGREAGVSKRKKPPPRAKVNQDCAYSSLLCDGAPAALFLLCDGHGSYGDHAAQCAVSGLAAALTPLPSSLSAPPAGTLADTSHAARDVEAAFAAVDADLLADELHLNSGCTALCAIFTHGAAGSPVLWIAHAGDSREVVASRTDAEDPRSPLWLRETADHLPDLLDERERIERCGGYVSEANAMRGIPSRVWSDRREVGPGLSMSRSLGDASAKAVGVVCTPELQLLRIDPAQDPFILLASDGLWDVISSQEACKIVDEGLRMHAGHAGEACARLLSMAKQEWRQRGDYRDDITIICVNIPKLTAFLARLEEERTATSVVRSNSAELKPGASAVRTPEECVCTTAEAGTAATDAEEEGNSPIMQAGHGVSQATSDVVDAAAIRELVDQGCELSPQQGSPTAEVERVDPPAVAQRNESTPSVALHTTTHQELEHYSVLTVDTVKQPAEHALPGWISCFRCCVSTA